VWQDYQLWTRSVQIRNSVRREERYYGLEEMQSYWVAGMSEDGTESIVTFTKEENVGEGGDVESPETRCVREELLVSPVVGMVSGEVESEIREGSAHRLCDSVQWGLEDEDDGSRTVIKRVPPRQDARGG